MRKRIPRNVWILSITSFLTDISSEMLFNLLPLFLVNVLGVRIAVVGLIEGLAETTASLIKLGSGALSDYLGNRKTLTVIGRRGGAFRSSSAIAVSSSVSPRRGW